MRVEPPLAVRSEEPIDRRRGNGAAFHGHDPDASGAHVPQAPFPVPVDLGPVAVAEGGAFLDPDLTDPFAAVLDAAAAHAFAKDIPLISSTLMRCASTPAPQMRTRATRAGRRRARPGARRSKSLRFDHPSRAVSPRTC
jgi:hypothetical protein